MCRKRIAFNFYFGSFGSLSSCMLFHWILHSESHRIVNTVAIIQYHLCCNSHETSRSDCGVNLWWITLESNSMDAISHWRSYEIPSHLIQTRGKSLTSFPMYLLSVLTILVRERDHDSLVQLSSIQLLTNTTKCCRNHVRSTSTFFEILQGGASSCSKWFGNRTVRSIKTLSACSRNKVTMLKMRAPRWVYPVDSWRTSVTACKQAALWRELEMRWEEEKTRVWSRRWRRYFRRSVSPVSGKTVFSHSPRDRKINRGIYGEGRNQRIGEYEIHLRSLRGGIRSLRKRHGLHNRRGLYAVSSPDRLIMISLLDKMIIVRYR